MLQSDWLSYYWAICYSLLAAKNARFLAAKKDLSLALTSPIFFILDIFDQLVGFYLNNYSSLPHGL